MPRRRNQTPLQALVSLRKLKHRRQRLQSVAFVTQQSSLRLPEANYRERNRSISPCVGIRSTEGARLLDLGRGRFRLWLGELQLVGHSDQLGQRPLILRTYTGRQGEKPTMKGSCILPSGIAPSNGGLHHPLGLGF